MYCLRVVPISRGIGVSELTYYSGVQYPEGSFVHVPIRGKERLALVLSTEDVKQVKATLRKSTFALQKIRKQKSKQCVTRAFIRAAEQTAKYHATTTGAILFATLPKALLELEQTTNEERTTSKPKLRGYIVPRLYQGLAKNRLDFYKTSIREAFAAQGSVFIVTPTIADAERVHEALRGGIEKYSYIIHSKCSQKAQKERISQMLTEEHPVLIIGTSQYLSIPRHDLATVIVEREGSSLYRTRNRPFLDTRVLAHELAAQLSGQLYLADLPLRIESVYRRERGEYEEIVTGHHRMHFKTRSEIYNLQGAATTPKKTFRVLSRGLLEHMRQVSEHGGRTMLYVARRGLSPVTLCRDCGTVVTCDECGVSVVLHKGKEENHFLCHSCGALRHARERCKQCRSWRLEAFGIGTELVEREVRKLFPDHNTMVLSSDTSKTHNKTKKIIDTFYSTHKSILIGTEMALPYLTKHVPLVGIVSLDSLLSLASWNIYERIACTVTRLREVSGEHLVLQTRRPEADILKTVLSGNFSGFYRSELSARKALGYPPYTVIIKVSVLGSHDTVHEKMEQAVALLAPYELVTFSRTLKVPNGKYSLHGFIRVARDEWPDEALLNRLRILPPSYTVIVDPDSIL
jgi:primosomal protein N' (replication factor Y)